MVQQNIYKQVAWKDCKIEKRNKKLEEVTSLRNEATNFVNINVFVYFVQKLETKLKDFVAVVSAKVALTVRKTAKENILNAIQKYVKILLN